MMSGLAHNLANCSVLSFEVARFEEGGEDRFVGGFHVGLLGCNSVVLYACHQAVVHRGHAFGGTALDDRTDVGDATALDCIGQGLVLEKNFVDGAAAFGFAFAEELGDDTGEASCKHDAHLVLLLGGEGIDDAVDGLGCVVRVERAEDEHTHRGATERELDGFQFAHLAEQKDVGVVPHRALKCGGKALGVLAYFTVHDDRLLDGVHKLDGVLNRDDVFAEVLVDVVDHRGEGGGLTTAGWSGDNDESFVEVTECFEGLG